MRDPFGRSVRYLRVSVTDRCDLRCVYCMAEEMDFLPKADLLSLEELERLCRSFVDLGVERLRLTGGEPLVRRGIVDLVTNLGRLLGAGRLRDLTMTTNGTQLTKYADGLARAGMKPGSSCRAVWKWGIASSKLPLRLRALPRLNCPSMKLGLI